MKELTELISLYEDGHITQQEMLFYITKRVTPTNCSEISNFPPNILQDIKQFVDKRPKTDYDWDRLLTLRLGMYRDITTEEYDQKVAEDKRLHRRGVELIRDYLGLK
jgi:hypothetical protein